MRGVSLVCGINFSGSFPQLVTPAIHVLYQVYSVFIEWIGREHD